MPDRVKRKTQVATNKNRQREPIFNTYLEFPLNIIEGTPFGRLKVNNLYS